MQVKRVWAVYWSATGTTKRVVTAVARGIAEKRGLPLDTYDFTLPSERQGAPAFTKEDVVVFGTPTYAGRVPNVLLKYLATVKGNGAAAVPVVTFGNRNFDDSLIELRDILAENGFVPFAAAAFVGEHSFSTVLAAGRPDADDLAQAAAFAVRVERRLEDVQESTPPVEVEGTPKPYRGYYQPRDRAGNPVDIRKVKPKTGEGCDGGGLCARVCPMGSINPENVSEIIGICIKCGACVKKCPKGAKYFDDPGFVYHKTELEEGYKRRADNRFFEGE
ncbi:MAG: class Ib ribonucleoside-diphosphate reductase assembly flavoprotein NrdI [Eubacteriales bacterium]|nr:class Ib ribonucleoside-diphosphate reductase assembly flavoprotein NrdI [Eubacteriales bacterium]